MKPNSKLIVIALVLATLTASAWAQTQTASNVAPANGSTTPAPTPSPAQPTITAADVQALKDALASQQQALAAQQRKIEALEEKLGSKEAGVSQIQSGTSDASAQPDTTQPKTVVATLQTNSYPAGGMQDSQAKPSDQDKDLGEPTNPLVESPLTIRFRGVSITPGGFAAAEFVRRSRALNTDVATPFNNVTMPGASQSQESEFLGSARQSRPTIYIASALRGVQLSSYLSADFLSAGTTSTSTQTNSYTLRLRQVWGQAKFAHGWSILGGQMWSLLTENRAGLGPSDDAGKVNDARPMTIDSTYNVGFTFARQYALRLTKDIADHVWLAVAIENPQATVTTHDNADNFLIGETGTTSNLNSTANYSFNPSPDVIAKIAFEPGFGHYEVFGVYSHFQDRVFPCEEDFASVACGSLKAASAVGAYNAAKDAGGFGANARWTFAQQHVVFGLHGLGGSAVGRYGAAQLSDVSVNADGTLHPIKDLQGLTTLEWHGKKLDLYGYSGAEYAARTWDFDPFADKGKGGPVGYGAPLFNNTGCGTETVPTANSGFAPGTLADCTADTRVVIEGTAGFWYKFYSGQRGTLRFGAQYSYLTRNVWSGVGGDPHGIDNMVFTSFRYYLP
jgi:Skp family chaperone for outer membrane proteins